MVEWGEIRPLLTEAAGGTVLQEVALDRMLKPALSDAGIQITENAVEAERSLFYRTLSPDPDTAARLARELRARQGLGSTRFDRLLRRNAGLRALVRDRASVSEEAVARLHEIRYGPKRQGRLIVVPTLAEAQGAIDRAQAGAFFGDLAVELSTDTSAARGGLLEPISRADASYPESLRDALWALGPDRVSAPVLVDEQYAVLMLVREIEGEDVELDSVRTELEEQVRLNQERILMDQLARQLLAEAMITIIDDAMKESWDAQIRRGR